MIQPTEEQRRAAMLQIEGAVIQIAGNTNADFAVAQSRANVDGLVNAMLRLSGPVETTEFLFAVVDRAAGGLKQPTALVLPVAFDPGTIKLRPTPWYERLGYSVGVAHGVLIAMALVALLWRP